MNETSTEAAGSETSVRVTGSDTSRLSIAIGLMVAAVLLAIVGYWIVLGHAKTKEITGFDPNRPVQSDEILRKRLSPDQYHVTRENGTETAFRNAFWENTRAGLYVDVITGEPLFTSLDKFDGGTGRPTFTKPISKDVLVEKLDTSFDMQRTEVRAKRSDAHLGHVFPDPKSPTGQRYAVNSAAFRFIAQESMQAEGYGTYLSLLDQKK